MGGLFSRPKAPKIVQAPPPEPELSQAELSLLADEESKRKGKKRKEVTQTVLTSPLGASGATTQKPKLGG